jgi:hypothetical protein
MGQNTCCTNKLCLLYTDTSYDAVPIVGLYNQSEQYSIWIAPSSVDSGVSGSLYVFPGVCAVSAANAEG